MGRRGPKRGQYRYRPVAAGSAAPAPSGPKFSTVEPRCPAWLDPSAKAVWRRVVRELSAAGTLATVDAELLASYSTSVADLAAVTRSIGRSGVVIEVPTFNRNGKPTGHVVEKPNPLLRTKDALLGRMKQLADALGVGPVARSRQGALAVERSEPVNRVLQLRDRIAAIRAESAARHSPGA